MHTPIHSLIVNTHTQQEPPLSKKKKTLISQSLINSSFTSSPLAHDIHITKRHHLRSNHARNTLFAIGPPGRKKKEQKKLVNGTDR